MEVKILFGTREERDNPNFEVEKEILYGWSSILEKRYSHDFLIISNSCDYTTLQPKGCLDLLRLKYGGAKWIKVFIPRDLSKSLMDDPRFADENKKSSIYWKSKLKDTNIEEYFDVLDAAFDYLKKQSRD